MYLLQLTIPNLNLNFVMMSLFLLRTYLLIVYIYLLIKFLHVYFLSILFLFCRHLWWQTSRLCFHAHIQLDMPCCILFSILKLVNNDNSFCFVQGNIITGRLAIVDAGAFKFTLCFVLRLCSRYRQIEGMVYNRHLTEHPK